MNQPAEGVPIPQTADPKKMDSKALFDLLQEERRNFERRLMEERQRARMELDRLRSATSQHIKELEDTNRALLKSLTRMQNENERLGNEIVAFQVRLEDNGAKPEPAPAAQPPTHLRLAAPPDPFRPGTVPVVSKVPTLSEGAVPIPPRPQQQQQPPQQ